MRPLRRTAFTMIELIIIIVVVGLLAGIGIIAYGSVVSTSQDRAAAASLTDVGREAAVLAAQNGESEWSQADFATALADTAAGPALSGSGVSAAAKLALVNAAADSTNSSSMSYGQVSLQLRTGGVAGLAMKAASGHCVFVKAVLPQQVTTWKSSSDLGGNCLASVGLDGGPSGSYSYTALVASGSTPLAPGAPTATLSGSTVNLSWPTVPGATAGYTVYRSADGGATWTSLTAGLTSPAYADSTATTAGATYSYAVTASAANESPKSPAAQLTLAPAAPTGLQAAPHITTGSQTATLSWTAAAGATSYTLTTSPAGGQPTTTSTTGTSVTVNTPATDTAYTFTVTATNAGGPGPASSPVSFTTTGVPGSALALEALNYNSGTVQVLWQAAPDATSYVLQRSTDQANWVTIYTGASGWYTGAGGLQWLSDIDSGLTNGTTYYYRIAGTNAYGTGAYVTNLPYSKAQPQTSNTPVAAVDSVANAGGNAFTISGWIVNPISATEARGYNIRIDNSAGTGWSRNYDNSVDAAGQPWNPANNTWRSDLANAYPGAGPSTGFKQTIGGIVAGSHQICFIPINGGINGGAGVAGSQVCYTITVTN